MLTNGIAVISCSEQSSEEFIKRIVDNGATGQNSGQCDRCSVLHIETKYYSADVNFVSVTKEDIPTLEVANEVEAVLVIFDSTQLQSFRDAQNWLSVVESFGAPVTLLISSSYIDDNSVVKRSDALEWCLENQFEFIELFPCEDNSDSETDDDFQETKGYQRIVQALHANTWSHMTLKDPPVYKPSEAVLCSLKEDNRKLGLTSDDSAVASGDSMAEPLAGANSNSSVTNGTSAKIDQLFEEDRWLFEAVGQEDPGGESFESMFSKILNMKEKASTLVGEERKLYAEKVAVEFWKAIGGDEEEISSLSSDEN